MRKEAKQQRILRQERWQAFYAVANVAAIFVAVVAALALYDRVVKTSPKSTGTGVLSTAESTSVVQARDTSFTVSPLTESKDRVTTYGRFPNGTLAPVALTPTGEVRSHITDQVSLELAVNVVYSNDTNLAQQGTIQAILDGIANLTINTGSKFNSIIWNNTITAGAVSAVLSPVSERCILTGAIQTGQSSTITLEISVDGINYFAKPEWSIAGSTDFMFYFTNYAAYFRFRLGTECTFTPHVFVACNAP